MSEHLKISELNSYVDDMLSSELFTISKVLNSSVYSSMKLNYEQISSDMIPRIENLPSADISGQWKFNNANQITVPTKSITENESIINIEYATKRFLEEFSKLSAEIYEKIHIPSYVGEIIYTTSLKTEEKVQKYYGYETSWVQIPGRFILGSDSKIGFRIGQAKAEIKVNNIPSHEHTFKADDTEKEYNVTGMITPAETQIVKCGSDTAEPSIKTATGETFPIAGDRNIALDMAVNKKFSSENKSWDEDMSGGHRQWIYGEDDSGSRATIKPDRGGEVPHNNMPPFYTVYIWKRVK